jgi:hypothetical protein
MRLSALRTALLLTCLGACSSDPDDPSGDPGNTEANAIPNQPAAPAAPAGAGGSSGAIAGVSNFNRPPGMAIGQGASGSEGPPVDRAPIVPAEEMPAEIAIPEFDAPTAETPPPCAGCVELSMLVDDINQRDEFGFSAGGAMVTQVVWNVIIPFNSDQLFVQPFVDGAYGTYTNLAFNNFPLGVPATITQTLAAGAAANSIGLAIGSSGAWTGDMTMSVFVDSVTITGGAQSRTFDQSAEGLAPRTDAHAPAVVHHP